MAPMVGYAWLSARARGGPALLGGQVPEVPLDRKGADAPFEGRATVTRTVAP